MAITVKQRPLKEIADILSAKTPIGAALKTDGWEAMPRALRESAFFSAGVESVKALEVAQRGLVQILEQMRNDNGTLAMDRSKWIEEIQGIANGLGLRAKEPGSVGSIRDFGSERRLAEIFRQQISGAQSQSYYLSGQDPDVLDAWPAQELVRVRESKDKRDWGRRWVDAGGSLVSGRMVALKTDGIWTRISRFGRPWPPFDFGSGMGLEEIDREEAERLGLIKPGEILKPSTAAFDTELARELAAINKPEWRAAMRTAFGDQIDFDGNQVRWKNGTPGAVPLAPPPAPVPTNKKSPPEITAVPGTPLVSASADLKWTKIEVSRYRPIIDAIDQVHGDGLLRSIPFNNKVSSKSNGTYWSYSDAAISIGVRKNLPGGELTLVHEIGHWLDHIGIPSSKKFASESPDSPLWAITQTIQQTNAYRALQEFDQDISWREYALQPRECFARAYAQFIAEETEKPELLKQRDKVINDQSPGMPAFTQWTPEDFAPVRAEFVKVFRALGWMK